MQTHPQRLRNRFCCSVRDKGCWRRWWCRASIVSAHFPPRVADRMANRVGCREVNWVGEFVEHQTKLAWSMMMNLVLLSSLFLSLSFLFFAYARSVFKQAWAWRSTTSRTSEDCPSPSTSNCRRFRRRNKCIHPSAPLDGTNNKWKFKHISTHTRACISLMFNWFLFVFSVFLTERKIWRRKFSSRALIRSMADYETLQWRAFLSS